MTNNLFIGFVNHNYFITVPFFSSNIKRHHLQRPSSSRIVPFSFPISSSIRCSLALPDMDTAPSQGLYPLRRCKTIHLVRHAQGIHNVAGELDHSAYLSPDLFDAHLTPLGWQQVDNLRKHVHSSGLSKRIELVIVSPLLRTMQTAVGVFGGEVYADGIDVPPLMVKNAGKSSRPTISSLNSPPVCSSGTLSRTFGAILLLLVFWMGTGIFSKYEKCQFMKIPGVHWCDKRRSTTEYKQLFPGIDFSLIESDDDILWKPDVREANEEVAARGLKFLNWLWTRKEKEIAVITHSGFLIHALGAFGNDCHPTVKSEICRPFNNCELRSVVIVDRSMISPNPLSIDHPGNIPSGPDVPSDNGNEEIADAFSK
ncbi:Phosphoglycerate mutase-like protein 2 [Abeliophyllum distichum]|uniref:Phosphoglycerate mutase-like protein 2 n=1 Tax=Abeliophyllum distichum TaxID=126358 RepID=A0ABD1Q5R3_9LAMI